MFEGGLEPVELMIILAIAVIVFGPKSFSGFGGGPTGGNGPKGGPPQHPLPVTGPVEKHHSKKTKPRPKRRIARNTLGSNPIR
jgi:hypothetical protein